MKKLIFLIIYWPLLNPAICQGYEEQDTNKDTVMLVPANTPEIHYFIEVDRMTGFSLVLFEGTNVYELRMGTAFSEMIIFNGLSWGNYVISDKKIILHDRVGGFKMKISTDQNGDLYFNRTYFPGINKGLLSGPEKEQRNGDILPPAFAIFDKEKRKNTGVITGKAPIIK